jgi:DNA-binding NtrC family response regulator
MNDSLRKSDSRAIPSTPSAVLLVDDEPQTLLSFKIILRTSGIKNIVTTEDSREVLSLLSQKKVAVIVLDLFMPHISGIELLSKIKDDFPYISVLIMTASNEVEIAVECMKKGAFDYLVKPVEKGRFLSSIKRALELSDLRNEVHTLKKYLLSDKLEYEEAFSDIITKSKQMRSIFQYMEAIAGSEGPVMITGETGVGKELISRAIHTLNGQKGNFVAVNIGGLDDTMFSDTLFGHKKGAYTGAEHAREGLIAKASEGTLFFDEIGDMPLPSQVKLLRLLQDKIYYPLGTDISAESTARIIVATNQNLKTLKSKGKFRKDLYYRLCTHHIHIPPLRERVEDIPLLLNHFLEKSSQSLKKKKPTPPRELFTLLSTYHFPGNVRELQTMVYDAVAQHKSGILSMESFKKSMGQEHEHLSKDSSPTQSKHSNLLVELFGRFPTLKEVETFLIEEALNISKGNQGIAASILGITRQALNKRLLRKKR